MGDVQAVLLEALGVVESARRKVRLSSWPVTRVGDIVQADELAREVSEPNFPDFVGATEVAAILCVSRRRLYELRVKEQLPEPTVELAVGPIWARPAIEAYLANRDRKSERPCF